MTTSEKLSWEQERAKGRDRHLLHSIRRAGLPFGVLMVVGKILISLLTLHPVAPIWRLLVEFGFYVLGFGALMGISSWQNQERDYAKPTEQDDQVT